MPVYLSLCRVLGYGPVVVVLLIDCEFESNWANIGFYKNDGGGRVDETTN